jgi:hypothetical protein
VVGETADRATLLVEGNDGRRGTIAAASTAPITAGSAADEVLVSEQAYLDGLVEVKEGFFPRIRSKVTAAEAAKLFGNWAELIPLSEGGWLCAPLLRLDSLL